MNALSITWKLRAEMLAILSACAPDQENRGSERRLVPSRLQRRKSDIRELLPPLNQSEVGLDTGEQHAAGEEQSRPRF
jgi:hypothetical protein